ncbi:unnamed protein product, partial [Urochloa humidicola]
FTLASYLISSSHYLRRSRRVEGSGGREWRAWPGGGGPRSYQRGQAATAHGASRCGARRGQVAQRTGRGWPPARFGEEIKCKRKIM